jgi:diguanylate cyclase
VPIGISIGIALAQPGEESVDVVRRADAALYRAKNGGRNRIEVWDPELDA